MQRRCQPKGVGRLTKKEDQVVSRAIYQPLEDEDVGREDRANRKGSLCCFEPADKGKGSLVSVNAV